MKKIISLLIGLVIFCSCQPKVAEVDVTTANKATFIKDLYHCNQDYDSFIKGIKESETVGDEMMIKAFNYYGETLNLYPYEYDPGIANMKGYFVLKDVCSATEYEFLITDYVDENIQVAKLTEGFYQVYYRNQVGVEMALTSAVNLNSSIYTITRNNSNKYISLLSSGYYLGNENLYISVKTAKLPDDVYDVIVDAGHGDYNERLGVIDTGVEANGLIESVENYYAAERMKQNLEAAGLKVASVRPYEDITTNQKLRIEKVYATNAKYVFSSHLNSAEEYNVESGFFVFSSYLSNQKLTASIVGNVSYNLYNSKAWDGLGMGYRTYEECPNIDYYYMLRSIGGRTLNSLKCDSLTNYNNIKGVKGTLIEYLYASTIKDSEYWKNNKDQLIDEVSNGIIEGLELK